MLTFLGVTEHTVLSNQDPFKVLLADELFFRLQLRVAHSQRRNACIKIPTTLAYQVHRTLVDRCLQQPLFAAWQETFSEHKEEFHKHKKKVLHSIEAQPQPNSDSLVIAIENRESQIRCFPAFVRLKSSSNEDV